MSSADKWLQIIKNHRILFTVENVVSGEVKNVVDAFGSMCDSGSIVCPGERTIHGVK